MRQSPSPKELGAYPTGTSTSVTNISLRKHRLISEGAAVSKNSVSASMRFARASSIDPPSLAMSNSGHNATKPSSSPIAVKRCAGFTTRLLSVYVDGTDRRSSAVNAPHEIARHIVIADEIHKSKAEALAWSRHGTAREGAGRIFDRPDREFSQSVRPSSKLSGSREHYTKLFLAGGAREKTIHYQRRSLRPSRPHCRAFLRR